MKKITLMLVGPSDQNATIDKIVQASKDEEFEDTHVWAHWGEPTKIPREGFTRNIRAIKRTAQEALTHLYEVLEFLGGIWTLEKCEDNYISYVRDDHRELVYKYDLDGPTIFDRNH
jgi:hypothetical protein